MFIAVACRLFTRCHAAKQYNKSTIPLWARPKNVFFVFCDSTLLLFKTSHRITHPQKTLSRISQWWVLLRLRTFSVRNLVYSGYESYIYFSPFAHTTSKQCLLEALILNRIREVRDNCNYSFSAYSRETFSMVCVLGGRGFIKIVAQILGGFPRLFFP